MSPFMTGLFELARHMMGVGFLLLALYLFALMALELMRWRPLTLSVLATVGLVLFLPVPL